MKSRKSVTLKDVAEVTGVSIVTASKVLNFGDENVASAQTVKDIYEAADRLGYQKKNNLGHKRGGKISVGVLLLPRVENLSLHPFYNDIYNAIKGVADAEDIYIDFFYSYYEIERNSFIQRRIIESKIDNLIIIGGKTDQFDRHFRNIVNISFTEVQSFGQCSIQFDMYSAVKDVISRLIASRREKILYFGGGGNFRPGMLNNDAAWREGADGRETGFLDAHLESGRPLVMDQLYECSFQPEIAAEALRGRLAQGPRDFDAIFAGDDMVALACIKELQKHEIRIPDEVAIVGFNNQDFCRYTNPSLSTIELNHRAAGVLAVELLKMKNDQEILPNMKLLIPCQFVKRHSCGL